MYGTVETGVLADGVDAQQLVRVLDEWAQRDAPDGWVDSRVVVSDDGRRFMVATRFRSETDYQELADSEAQHTWYAREWRPLLAQASDWFDGSWVRE